MALVEIEGLTISFGGRAAVSDLSLTIERGDRFGIIGESGSGKSLTALAIAGLLPETAQVSGNIRFDGSPLPADEAVMARLRGKRIGMVFQEPMTALNPLMTVGEQIEEAIALAEAADATLPDLLGEVGLEPAHAVRFPHQPDDRRRADVGTGRHHPAYRAGPYLSGLHKAADDALVHQPRFAGRRCIVLACGRDADRADCRTG
jgi:ABC-type dipeptide/oligopeptide/nickel transport system ATPase component